MELKLKLAWKEKHSKLRLPARTHGWGMDGAAPAPGGGSADTMQGVVTKEGTLACVGLLTVC